LTEYELGVVPLISVPTHLILDALGGLLLASSPWLFGFAIDIWMPHVILGLAEIGAAIFTQTQPLWTPRTARGPSTSATH
jgi:hypothetical protein